MKIPNGWKPFEFGKAVSFNPKVQFQRGEQYMFIEMDDVNPADKYVSGKEKRVYITGSCSKFRNDDVLFARITPCLDNKKIATAAIGENQIGFGSTEFIVLRAKENITVQQYVHYLSKSEYIIQNAINSYVGASGRQRADANFIKKVIIPIPKIPEQQCIASILSAYDDLIENNNKRIALLEQMAQQIYKEWFVRMRFPGYENSVFEKGVPRGWKWEKVEEIFKTSSGGTPSRKKEQEYYGGSIDWIKTGELKDTFIFDSEEKITESGLKNSSAKLFPSNTLLMAMYGVNIGQLGISVKSSTANQAVCVFLPIKPKEYSLYYSFFFFKSIRLHLFNISMGAAQQNLSQNIIKRLNYLRPDAKILLDFDNIQKPFFELILKLSIETQILKQTRDLLLPRLISGKLRVKEIKEEQELLVK